MRQFFWFTAQCAIIGGWVWWSSEELTQPPYSVAMQNVVLFGVGLAFGFTLLVNGIGAIARRLMQSMRGRRLREVGSADAYRPLPTHGRDWRDRQLTG
jgi:hypothetical protein